MSSSSLSLPGSMLSSCYDVLSLKQTNFGFRSRDGTAYLAARDSSQVRWKFSKLLGIIQWNAGFIDRKKNEL